MGRRGEIGHDAVPRGATGAGAGLGVLAAAVRACGGGDADRGHLSPDQQDKTRLRDAGDVSGSGHRLADGGQCRSDLHLDLRDRFEPCRRSRRAARSGLRDLPANGRSRRGQSIRDRDPRGARQHHRRGHRRLHSGIGGGTGRRLCFVGVPRRHGLFDHYRGSDLQADRTFRALGARRMKSGVAILTIVAFASVPLWLRDPYLMNALITTGIFIIGAMSLNLLLGFTGQLSLGHIAFFGIGVYVSALTSLGFDVGLPFGFRIVHHPWPPIAGFVLAIVAAGLCGYLVGLLSFRVRGAYFVIVTISFAEVVRLVALNWVELTQGPLALTNIPSIAVALPGLGDLTLRTKLQNYYLVLAVAVVTYLLTSRLGHSHVGRGMRGLMEDETLIVSISINVTRYLVLAAVVSAAIAGASGSLYAHYLRIIDPDIFLFLYTVTMVIMVITGGKGTLAGPIVGGVIFGFLPVVLRPVAAPAVQWILYGALMIVIVFMLPQGIVPALQRAMVNWTTPARKH